MWAIDHGLSFHTDHKLRTVIWDFAGQPLPEECVEAVAGLAAAPPPALDGLIDDDEIEALVARAERIVRQPIFPHVRSARAYPWPLI